jgi:hypothetical protein
MVEPVSKMAIAKQIDRIELELRLLKARLLRRDGRRRKPRTFAELRGAWKGFDYSLDEIRRAQYKIGDDVMPWPACWIPTRWSGI